MIIICNMRKIQVLTLILCFIFLAGCANVGSVKKLSSCKTISKEEAAGRIKERPRFFTRKRFVYSIAWNSIPVGRVIAESNNIIKYEGRDVYTVSVLTESNKFLSKIYRVEDYYLSYVDAETMTSRRYEADRKEGHYRKHMIVKYDLQRMEAIYSSLTDGSVKRWPIEKNVHDPVSTICYFMTLPITPGEQLHITVNVNEKNYELSGRVGEIELVKLAKMGSFPAFMIRPYAELNKKRFEKGKAWMYFSADKNRYPLFGVVQIPFGRVTATLKSVENI